MVAADKRRYASLRMASQKRRRYLVCVRGISSCTIFRAFTHRLPVINSLVFQDSLVLLDYFGQLEFSEKHVVIGCCAALQLCIARPIPLLWRTRLDISSLTHTPSISLWNHLNHFLVHGLSVQWSIEKEAKRCTALCGATR